MNKTLRSLALASTFFIAAAATGVAAQEASPQTIPAATSAQTQAVVPDAGKSVSERESAEELAKEAEGLRELLQKPNKPRPPTPEEEQAYQDLKKLLDSDLEKAMAPLRALEQRYAAGEIDRQTYEKQREELKQQRLNLWQSLINSSLGNPFVDLPEIFARAAEGCTADGKAVNLRVTLTINLDDVKKLLEANTETKVREDWGGYKQVIINDEFLDTMDKALRARINLSLSDINRNIITGRDLAALDTSGAMADIKKALDGASAGIREKYNLRVLITPSPIANLNKSCTLAAPANTTAGPGNPTVAAPAAPAPALKPAP